jgi:peptidoglycan DL-endopeptidase CwlO
MKKYQRLVTCCMIGTIAFASRAVVTKAAEIPIAGIDVALDSFYQNEDNEDLNIQNFLSTDILIESQNLSFAKVTDYVNIRKKADEESKILGKLYKNSAATILEKKGDWYKVKSGSVTGYIKAEFLVTGSDAVELGKKVGTRIATVNTMTLKLREKANTDATVLTLIPEGEKLTVKKEVDGWVKVKVDDDAGYVSSEYVDLSTVYKEAVSIEEEKAKLEAAEAKRNEKEQTQSNNSADRAVESASFDTSGSSSNSSLRNQIVSYALQFEGNPYVWGGTSLTNGTDCSGFTQSVFRNNGISISRTSRTQASGGRTISISNIQPGDLIFYGRSGTINHVGIYIGNGKVISASSPETGIRITNYNYRQPYKAVSYID